MYKFKKQKQVEKQAAQLFVRVSNAAVDVDECNNKDDDDEGDGDDDADKIEI